MLLLEQLEQDLMLLFIGQQYIIAFRMIFLCLPPLDVPQRCIVLRIVKGGAKLFRQAVPLQNWGDSVSRGCLNDSSSFFFYCCPGGVDVVAFAVAAPTAQCSAKGLPSSTHWDWQRDAEIDGTDVLKEAAMHLVPHVPQAVPAGLTGGGEGGALPL